MTPGSRRVLGWVKLHIRSDGITSGSRAVKAFERFHASTEGQREGPSRPSVMRARRFANRAWRGGLLACTALFGVVLVATDALAQSAGGRGGDGNHDSYGGAGQTFGVTGAAGGDSIYYRGGGGGGGAGAAGGFGAGVLAFLNGALKPGIEAVLDVLDFNRIAADSDLVITGEGKLDSQSFQGKVLDGVSGRTSVLGVPLIAIVGMADDSAGDYRAHGIDAVFTTNRASLPYEQLKSRATVILPTPSM